MKKLGVLLFVLVVGTVAGWSQNRRGQENFDPEQMAKRQTDRLSEVLDLNNDQKKRVYDLHFETNKKMRTLRERRQGGDFEEMRDEMGKIREEQNEKMKQILTGKQWGKYEEYLDERRERMRQRRPRGGMRRQ